ncbi:3-deoxy-8-phosphooctulonate synthase [bacterium]|nr:3-deoxy-8-phosphooctulonate synthase [bacterium]
MSIQTVTLTETITMGEELPVLFAGPCVVESEDNALQIATRVKEICDSLGIPYVFKASYDKANRTSIHSFRSIGIEQSLEVLNQVKSTLGLPILTDVHDVTQTGPVAEVADVLQIPAFLCRQTDLLVAAGKTGRAVNIKKGQFLAPDDIQYAIDKVRSTGNERVFVTERGFSFGYHNLVVDMRALPMMRRYAPVVFDATHSVQLPGGQSGQSGGQREFASVLARAAAAAGVDGFFIETHPDPANAFSDGSNMIPLQDVETVLRSLIDIHLAARPYTQRRD